MNGRKTQIGEKGNMGRLKKKDESIRQNNVELNVIKRGKERN